MIIGKLGFSTSDAFYYGLELALSRAGRKAFDVTAKTVGAVDVLLFTAFWYRDAYLFADFLRESGISRGGKPVIIIGGMQATMTPGVFAEMADYVFIGDADDSLGKILDEIEAGKAPSSQHLYRAGDDAVPGPAVCRPSAFAMNKGGGSSVVRIEIARGCKYKCAFCALSGLKPYSEVPANEIIPLLKTNARKRVSLFAPERTLHSEWPAIKAAIAKYKIHDLAQDARLENLSEISGSSVTFGLEGLSFRLRKAIGKPFTVEKILGSMGQFTRTRMNVAMIAVYLIADLPGETQDDWDEFAELLAKIGEQEWSRRLVLKPVLNPLSPKPFTKLEGAPIHIFRDYETPWLRLLRRQGGWGYRVVESLVWGPYRRLMDAIVQRAPGGAAWEIIQSLPAKYLRTIPPTRLRVALARKLLRLCGRHGVTLSMLERCSP